MRRWRWATVGSHVDVELGAGRLARLLARRDVCASVGAVICDRTEARRVSSRDRRRLSVHRSAGLLASSCQRHVTFTHCRASPLSRARLPPPSVRPVAARIPSSPFALAVFLESVAVGPSTLTPSFMLCIAQFLATTMRVLRRASPPRSCCWLRSPRPWRRTEWMITADVRFPLHLL